MIRSKLVVAALVGALLVLLGGTAANAQDPYAPSSSTTTTSTTAPDVPSVTVVRGETISVDGDSCAPGATVTVTWDDGTVLGTFTADANGDFSTTITVPSDASLGTHLVTATCGDVEQFLNVNVLAETVNNVNNGTLARTGSSNTGPLVGLGAAAIVLGGAFLYGARRPRRA